MATPKERLRAGEAWTGCFLNLGSPITAEIVARAGFDFVVIDLEHGAGTEADVLSQLQALAASGTVAVVRAESHARQRTHRVLDLGAHGIMFPRVNNAGEARAAVATLRYPPDGVRGVAAMNRACDFGAGFRAYVASANQALLGVLQIETEESLRHVEDIAAVDGADVLFIGPADLTQSLGILGQFDHPRYQEALETTAAAASKHGKATGVLMAKAEDFDRYYDLGFRFLACGSDGGMVANSARALSQALQASRAARQS